MDADQPIIVDSPIVSCDGGGGALGHPQVFLRIGESGEVVCPYCSRRFVLTAKAAAKREEEAAA